MSSTDRVARRMYRDPRYDGTRRFYGWMRQQTNEETVLLNLGAGPATGSQVRSFRGEVAKVVGADVHPCVLENVELDEAVLIKDDVVPFSDATFDVVFSDYVLEHVERPDPFLCEAHRLLKPGGSFFFRTPNIWHYIGLISSVTPHWFHRAVANRARGHADQSQEPWPTFYRLNTCSRISLSARKAGFRHIELQMVETEPSYLRFHLLPFLLGVGYERLVNSTEALAGLRANIFGRLTR